MKKIFYFICIFLLLISSVYAKESDKFEVEFNKCVDGDTFSVNIEGEVKKVRMLAIDTPETVKAGTDVQPYGKEASNYTCDKLTNAKKIELEYDPKSDKTDKYDRLLAWVYVDDSMLQKELLSLGYAKTNYIYGKYNYLDELYEIEKEAANNKLGIWSNEEYENNEIDEIDEINKSFKEEIIDIVKDYVKDIVKSIFKDIKKELKATINSIFK